MALALTACGGGAPEVAPLRGSPPSEELPAQFDKAFANALHRVHLDASPPSSCTDCHRIEDKDLLPAMRGRCEACHEGRSNPIHVKISPDVGRECVVCHDFVGRFVGPWRCVDCHVESDPPRVDQAPKTVAVHGKESCAGCHTGHAGVEFSVQCRDCHDQVKSAHRREPLGGNEDCLECHGAHEAGDVAASKCAACHEAKIPAAARFKGHDACGTCHDSHPVAGTQRSAPLRACRSCHDVETMPLEVPGKGEHARCSSCHAPHSVQRSAEASCVRCHEGTAVVHGDPKAAACSGCHDPHAPTTEAKSCTSCHEEAKHDAAWHAGDTRCAVCHAPHAFDLTADPSRCLQCHRDPDSGRRLRPKGPDEHLSEGHADCGDCHVRAAHQPSTEPGSCIEGPCHDSTEGTSKGHVECRDCHRPHSGAVLKTCRDCHGDHRGGKHAEATEPCAECHRPHGPDTVRGAARPRACSKCHDDALPGLHGVAKHSNCGDCHAFHGAKHVMSRSTCIDACHAEEIPHEAAAVSCVGCHPFR